MKTMTEAPPLDNGKTTLGFQRIYDLKAATEAQLADLQFLYETLEALQDQALRLEPNEELIRELEERLARHRAAVERSRQWFTSVLPS